MRISGNTMTAEPFRPWVRGLALRTLALTFLALASLGFTARGASALPEEPVPAPKAEAPKEAPVAEAPKATPAAEVPKEAPKEAPVAEAPKEAPKEAPAAETKEAPKPESKAEPPKGAVLKILRAAGPQGAKEAEAKVREAVQQAMDAAEAVKVEVQVAPGAAPGTTAPVAEPKPETPAETKPETVAKKKEPMIPMFRLRDGTRLAGTPSLLEVHVATAYGRLVVPSSEILRIRFAATRDDSADSKVAEAIAGLGSDEFDRREEAVTQLREIGTPALEALRKAAESEDEEVKTRAEKLVSEIEETVEEEDPEMALTKPISGDDDEVVTFKFTAMGRIEEEAVEVTSRYGKLKLSRKDIVSIVFQEESFSKRTVQVPGTSFAAANKWLATEISLTQGESLHITASGTLNLENFGQTTGPEGTTNISGNQLESFPAGALVAKIGEKGKAFLVASEFQGNANATGKLQFGISLQNGQVSGQYTVEVETEEAN